ncbi:MAG TPA: PAS domain S-box protein [Ignavibacteriaceae bacterium]|nr:PAS domain S-box protein [Ignavibacteriaceae bacterium]
MKLYGKTSIKESEFNLTELSVIYHLNHQTGKYEFISPGILSLTGYSSTEINDIGFENIVKGVSETTSDDFTSRETELNDREARHYSAKYLVITKDGRETWLQDKATRFIDAYGNNLFSVGTLKKYTEADNLVEKFKYSNENLETVFDLANLLILVIDEDQKIRLINKKACDLVGIEQDEILGKEWTVLVPDNLKHVLRENIENTFREIIPPPQDREIVLISKSGEPKIIQYNNAVLRDETGKIVRIMSLGLDVTEKKKEEKIQEVVFRIIQNSNAESDIKELFHFIHSGISELMPAENFYIALYNEQNDLITFPYFIDKYDKDAPPMKFGRGLTEYILRSGKAELITRERDNELVAEGETEVVGTQSAIWLGIPLKIRDHTMGALVVQDYENEDTYTEKEKQILEVVSYPISRTIERKIVEQERKELILKLSQLNTSKDKLFSLISHDLRSPFNSLLGFSEILTTEYDSLTHDEVKEYLNVIYEASKNLYGMTNNLLQYSRFQVGRIDFQPVEVNLTNLLKKNLNLLKGNAIRKEISLSADFKADVFVFADEDMLNSTVQNIISNSIKFTQRGGEVKIKTEVIPFFDEATHVKVTIEDNGIGMSRNELEKILSEEIISTPGTEREYGTGLGLLIVKEFVEKNGGRIEVKSKINQGTSFSFTLPVSDQL